MSDVVVPLWEREDKHGQKYLVAKPHMAAAIQLDEVIFLIWPEGEKPTMKIRPRYEKVHGDKGQR